MSRAVQVIESHFPEVLPGLGIQAVALQAHRELGGRQIVLSLEDPGEDFLFKVGGMPEVEGSGGVGRALGELRARVQQVQLLAGYGHVGLGCGPVVYYRAVLARSRNCSETRAQVVFLLVAEVFQLEGR